MPDLSPTFLNYPTTPVLPRSSEQLHYGITSWGLYRQNLDAFFPECDLSGPLASRFNSKLDGVLAWGNKPSALVAINFAKRQSIPLIRVEDGFLYGLEPGSLRMGLVVDDLGIYYDARHRSLLESLINSLLSSDQLARAQSVREQWITYGVSKYNHAPNWQCGDDVWFREPFILLIDQTRGDQSIFGALADESSFMAMLDAALSQTAIDHIVIKVHPEVALGNKLGHFDLSPDSPIFGNHRIRVMSEDYSLPSVIRHASAVYTVSSQAGFEALLWGKQVYTFGMPFYAGWGLTYDQLPRPSRRSDISLEQLIHGALIAYTRYLHPETGQLIQVEELIQYLGFQRKEREQLDKILAPIGFSKNKFRHLRRFTKGSKLIKHSGQNSDDPTIPKVLWGIGERNNTRATDANIIRVEDGFIRSIGLGAALATPYSWVFDRRGIYYNHQSQSDLEFILQNATFDDEDIKRAQGLKDKILILGVSKYNLEDFEHASTEITALKGAKFTNTNKRMILVTGQVESDASIKYGGVDIFTNLELLKEVRSHNPDAFIVYKPHPDIANSIRFTGGKSSDHQNIYDLMISNASLNQCLDWVDELHTITSLSGFEALTRDVPVFCYGLPFYAGWGLTHDRHPTERRSRKLHILELISGTLIKYPRYIHPKSNLFCTPESLVDCLHSIKHQKNGAIKKTSSRAIRLGAQVVMSMIHKINKS